MPLQNEMVLGGGGEGDQDQQMEVDQVVPDQPLKKCLNITEEVIISWMRLLGLAGEDVFERCVSEASANHGVGAEATNVPQQVLDALDVQVVPQLPFGALVENCLKDVSDFSDELLHAYLGLPRGKNVLARAAIKLAQKQCVGLDAKLNNIQAGLDNNNIYPSSQNAIVRQNEGLNEVYGVLHETKMLVKPFLKPWDTN